LVGPAATRPGKRGSGGLAPRGKSWFEDGGHQPRRLRRSLKAGSGIEEAGSRLKEAFVASFYAIAIVFVAISLLNLIEYRRID
jgi:hypothetical protein